MSSVLLPLSDQQTLFAAIADAAGWLQRRLDGALSIAGITYAEYRLLRGIADSPGSGISRVNLATLAGLTPSGVTRALRPLEKLGFVDTERDQRDARRALATLTSAGEDLTRNATSIIDDAADSILDASAHLRAQTETLRAPLLDLMRG